MTGLSDAALEKSNATRPMGERGQGRKPGSKVKVLRAHNAQKMINEGRAPVNVMLRNMWWWDEAANNLGGQLLQHSEALKFAKSDEAKFEALQTFNDLLQKFFHARDKAQSCAVDAAPYFHARLQSVKIDASITNVTPQKVSKDAPDEKFIDGYATLVNQSYRVDADEKPFAEADTVTEED